MRFVYHLDDQAFPVRVDGRFIGPIPPGEVFEVPEITGTDCNNNGPFEYRIPEQQVLKLMLDAAWYHGLVEVPVQPTKDAKGHTTGYSTSETDAKKAAKAALELAQDQMLNNYVTSQQERILRDNKPAIPPSVPIEKILKLRGLDLKKDFNIDPPGYVIDKKNDQAAQIAELQAQLARLMEQLGEKTAKVK